MRRSVAGLRRSALVDTLGVVARLGHGAMRPFWMHQVVEYIIGVVFVSAGFGSLTPAVPAALGAVVILRAFEAFLWPRRRWALVTFERVRWALRALLPLGQRGATDAAPADAANADTANAVPAAPDALAPADIGAAYALACARARDAYAAALAPAAATWRGPQQHERVPEPEPECEAERQCDAQRLVAVGAAAVVVSCLRKATVAFTADEASAARVAWTGALVTNRHRASATVAELCCRVLHHLCSSTADSSGELSPSPLAAPQWRRHIRGAGGAVALSTAQRACAGEFSVVQWARRAARQLQRRVCAPGGP